SHRAAIGAHCTVGMAAEVEHRPRETRPGGHAEMHLVAPHRHAGRDLMAGRLSQPLVAAEHGVDVEEAEPNRLAGRSFAALGIGDMAAQHLIPAAQAEDVPAVPMMHQQVDVPALIAQENAIGEGRRRAGQDYQRGIARITATGTSPAAATPISAISPGRSLIAAGLPAPPTRTISPTAGRRGKPSRTCGSSEGAKARYSRADRVE